MISKLLTIYLSILFILISSFSTSIMASENTIVIKNISTKIKEISNQYSDNSSGGIFKGFANFIYSSKDKENFKSIKKEVEILKSKVEGLTFKQEDENSHNKFCGELKMQIDKMNKSSETGGTSIEQLFKKISYLNDLSKDGWFKKLEKSVKKVKKKYKKQNKKIKVLDRRIKALEEFVEKFKTNSKYTFILDDTLFKRIKIFEDLNKEQYKKNNNLNRVNKKSKKALGNLNKEIVEKIKYVDDSIFNQNNEIKKQNKKINVINDSLIKLLKKKKSNLKKKKKKKVVVSAEVNEKEYDNVIGSLKL